MELELIFLEKRDKLSKMLLANQSRSKGGAEPLLLRMIQWFKRPKTRVSYFAEPHMQPPTIENSCHTSSQGEK